MKDYFALLSEPRKFQKSLKTEPSKPSKGAYEGNDGLVDKGFQNFVSSKLYISASGDLVIPFGTDDTHKRDCEGEFKETGKEIVYCAICHQFTFTNAQARYEFEERSAIVEFEGGLPRDKAEGIALAEVLQGEPGRKGGMKDYARK